MKLKNILLVSLLFALPWVNGCATKSDENSFWSQCIKANGYGLSMFSPYGPFNFGYLTYERNANCTKDIKQQTPIAIP
jgi:hypothetical protein